MSKDRGRPKKILKDQNKKTMEVAQQPKSTITTKEESLHSTDNSEEEVYLVNRNKTKQKAEHQNVTARSINEVKQKPIKPKQKKCIKGKTNQHMKEKDQDMSEMDQSIVKSISETNNSTEQSIQEAKSCDNSSTNNIINKYNKLVPGTAQSDLSFTDSCRLSNLPPYYRENYPSNKSRHPVNFSCNYPRKIYKLDEYKLSMNNKYNLSNEKNNHKDQTPHFDEVSYQNTNRNNSYKKGNYASEFLAKTSDQRLLRSTQRDYYTDKTVSSTNNEYNNSSERNCRDEKSHQTNKKIICNQEGNINKNNQHRSEKYYQITDKTSSQEQHNNNGYRINKPYPPRNAMFNQELNHSTSNKSDKSFQSTTNFDNIEGRKSSYRNETTKKPTVTPNGEPYSTRKENTKFNYAVPPYVREDLMKNWMINDASKIIPQPNIQLKEDKQKHYEKVYPEESYEQSKSNLQNDGLLYTRNHPISSLKVINKHPDEEPKKVIDLAYSNIRRSIGRSHDIHLESCANKTLEACLGILRLKRIFKDKTYQEQGYKYKTPFQTNVLNDILKITPYPNAQMRDTLAILLNLNPRTIQIWFQNARQGGENQMSREEIRRHKSGIIIDARMVVCIFEKNSKRCKESDH